jgi:TPR repeat protein
MNTRNLVFVSIFVIMSLPKICSADGMAAFNRKDYNEAYRVWSRNPETAEASYGIGRIVLEGLGAAPRNAERGISLIHRAAAANYRPALAYLADYYERTGNVTQAIKFLDKQSDNKDLALEQRILSLLLKSTKGESTNSPKFCETSLNISKLGGQIKQLDMAMCAMNGHQSNQNKDEAENIIGISANDAYSKMEYVEAQRLWSVIPDKPESMYGLGILSLRGLPGTKKNVERGIQLLEKASNAGYKEAANELAKYFAANGDNEKAIGILKKSCDSGDTSCNKTMVDLYSRSKAGLTKEYCERLEGAKFSEDSPQYVNYLSCAFSGLVSSMSKDEAGNRLKNQLQRSPTVQGLIQLAPYLLKRDSQMISYQDFEKAVWAIDPELKNSEIKSLAKTSGINDDLIADLPSFTDEQKSEKMSANFIAALGGNQKKLFVVARHLASKALSEKSYISRAQAVLGLLESEKDSVEYKKIRVEILRSNGQYGSHLRLVHELLKSGLKDEKYIQEQLSYQYKAAQTFLTYSEPIYRLDDVEILSQAVSASNLTSSQSEGLPILLKLESKYRASLDPSDISEYTIKTEKLDRIAFICKEIQKRLPATKKSQTSEDLKISDSSPRQADIESINGGQRSGTKSSERPGMEGKKNTVNEYSRFRYECDQGTGPSCTRAAELILSGETIDDLRKLTTAEKKDLAMRILERASNFKEIEGTSLLYDLLNSERNAESRQKADEILKLTFFVSSISGQLRIYEKELRFDPLRTTASLILDKKSILRRCDEVGKLASGKLNDRDKRIASDISDGFTCSSVRKLQ